MCLSLTVICVFTDRFHVQTADIEPEEIFQFLDDMMMYDWLRKNKPDGERTEELETRRNNKRQEIAESLARLYEIMSRDDHAEPADEEQEIHPEG